ncbi:cupredoxin domain-containing protein [Sphingomonas sp. URHD0057]|uniref:cupredoxin domain-containing protein n=1 Tax=Sphingomonas sp. URHD0057 TaxID=1380389 RepID=UPI000AD8B88C|nr:cupredoxin domain-containing protein [Sphingomonas sp. URHD0057]
MRSFRFLGTALLLAISAPGAAQPASYVVQVYSYGFTPRPIHLAAGRPVTLTFVNSSGNGHDFTAKSFFASSRIITGAAPGGEIELAGGETRRITLVPRVGVYKAHCSHFLHATMGMTDQIIVN